MTSPSSQLILLERSVVVTLGAHGGRSGASSASCAVISLPNLLWKVRNDYPFLKPVLDRSFPLCEAAAAQHWLEKSGQFGKVI